MQLLAPADELAPFDAHRILVYLDEITTERPAAVGIIELTLAEIAIERLIDASDLIASKSPDPGSQVLVRNNRRSVVDVLDEVGLNTDSAQRGQNVPGNARVFVLVVGLRAAGTHPP